MSDKKDVIIRELYLIRHGETFANLEGFVPADLRENHDPLLTETGKAQAEALGKYYKRIKFDAVYSSGLRRAALTADSLVKYQESKELLIMPDLSEVFIDPDYEGLTFEELKSYCPDAELKMAEGYPEDSRLAIPDYKPRNDDPAYFARAEKVIDYIKKGYGSGEKIAVVSHAGFLTYILFYLLGFRDREPEEYDLRVSNTGVSKITWFEHGTYRYGDMVFDSINDMSHLADF